MGAVVIYDLIANRPAASEFNKRWFFVATDDAPTSYDWFVCDGTDWLPTSSGGGTGTIEEITSTDLSVTVTDPTGPVTDLAVNFPAAVDSIAKAGDTPLTGDVTLSEGTGVTLTQVGQDIEIAATGGATLDQQGSGSPVGAVTPTAIGYRYTDTDNGALYLAVGATSADWVAADGPADTTIAGYSVQGGDQPNIIAPTGGLIRIAVNGSVLEIFIDPGDGVSIKLPAGTSFLLRDSADNPMLQMTEGSPNLHIPTGGSVIADL